MEGNSKKDSERERSVESSGLAGIFHFLQTAHSLGVRTIVLCPGGRNAPMIQALGLVAKKLDLEVLSFFDERSAAFFALGRAKRDLSPVIVSVTSGTAAAELLPAVIEAHATDVALILATADRPHSHRGTGSPQSMWQQGLFTKYAPTVVDWQDGEVFPDWENDWDQKSPVHINLCHQEPLWSKNPAQLNLETRKAVKSKHLPAINSPFPEFKNPLVILGSLAVHEQEIVKKFCQWYGAPVLTEASSGLREVDAPNWLKSGERIVKKYFKENHFDGVIRFGGVPSWRLWRDLENWKLPVLTYGQSQWSGLPGREVVKGDLNSWLFNWMTTIRPGNVSLKLFEKDREVYDKTQSLLLEYPESEPALMYQISKAAKANSLMYLGNSRPVRDWNEFASLNSRFDIQENRGLNGIDGQVSSFLGNCKPNQENWAILGDLTTLYDLAGPWALRHLDASTNMRLVVINNGGGRIFENLFPDVAFINSHDIDFSDWAKMWKCSYQNDLKNLPNKVIIELKPNNEQTQAIRLKLGQL